MSRKIDTTTIRPELVRSLLHDSEMTSLRLARAFVVVSCGVVAACSDGSDDASSSGEASADSALIERLANVGTDGIWVGFEESSEVVRAFLPPELELDGPEASGATYPLVLAFQRLEVHGFGPVPFGALAPNWDEAVLLVPAVRFHGASSCSTSTEEQFTYVVSNPIGNRVVAEAARRAFSRNRFAADVSIDRTDESMFGTVRVDGTLSLDVELTHAREPATTTPPAIVEGAWALPAIAPGASAKFVRYRPTITTSYVQQAQGHMKTDERLFGLRSRSVDVGPGDASAARVKGTVELLDIRPCE